MSFLGSVLKPVTSAVSSIVNPIQSALGSFAGPLFSGILGSEGARQQNRANSQAVQAQMGFQRAMSNSAYQRGMADMKKAGLNPILAYRQGGASSPGGATFQAASPLGSGARFGLETASALSTVKKQASEVNKIDADTKKVFQEIKNLGAQYNLTEQQTAKVANEVTKVFWEAMTAASEKLKVDYENIPRAQIAKFLSNNDNVAIAGHLAKEFGLSIRDVLNMFNFGLGALIRSNTNPRR